MQPPRLNVTELGQGRPIALVYGSPTPRSHFVPLAEALSRDFRVLLVDLPGHGDSPPLDGPLTIPRTLECIEATLQALGAVDSALLGLSSTSYRVLALATRGVLCPPLVYMLAGMAHMSTEEQQTCAGFCQVIESGADLSGMLVGRFLSPGFAASHPEVAREVGSWHTPRNKLLVQELQALATAEDLRPLLPQLECDVVVRVGELDVATPVTAVKEVTDLARGRLEVVPEAGHLLLCEDFDGTVESVRTAMREVGK